jgi:Flp pilus assembly protein TadB
MALSARDNRIFSAIERDLTRTDPRWTRRCARRTRRFDRLERKRSPLPGLVRRRLSLTAAFAAWIALVCADASRGPGAWLWAALAATVAAISLTVARTRTRRRRRSGGLVL